MWYMFAIYYSETCNVHTTVKYFSVTIVHEVSALGYMFSLEG